MRIQELERKTGLERPSIRFYEKEGLLNPKRLENGYREYSDEDVALLRKIKLLRRLGLSIDKIRLLQQGSEDLSVVIARQMGYHASQIDDHRRCRAVCEAMRNDGVDFSTLDAEYYLKLFQEIRIGDRALGRSDFREDVPKEIHPWRRYTARWLDFFLWGALMEFILIVVVRIRPVPGDFVNTLLNIGITALFVPAEALMLHKFGTTPGKWIMGLRLEYYQGGNLPFSEALYRSLRVYVSGLGLGIPFVQTCLAVLRYCQLTGRSWRRFAKYNEVEGPQDMPWDEATEIIYESRNWKRGVAAGLLLAASCLLISGTVLDAFKPRYRGSELTVAQIAQNYNATLEILYDGAEYYETLREDGSKKPVASNTVIYDINSSETNQQMQFTYDVEDGVVHAVSVHHTWDHVFHLAPVSDDPMRMAFSLLLAQEDCGIQEAMELMQLFQSHLNQKIVSFSYKNLLIEWTIRTDLELQQGVISQSDGENHHATLDFCVTIQ